MKDEGSWAWWSARQRATLAVLVLILLAFLSIRYAFNRSYVSDPQPEDGPRADEAQHRIDPNTADWATLAAMPRIGKSMGQRIVETRERLKSENGGEPAFRTIEDLQRVKGIGQATTRAIEPYLMFPELPSR